MHRKAPKDKPAPKPPSREEKDEVLRVIIEMIDQFCREHLNEEYAVLCRKLAEKLGRKRPSPLLHEVDLRPTRGAVPARVGSAPSPA